MFVLSVISDVVKIHPSDFWKPTKEALSDEINKKYANKVIQQVGLAIAIFDFLTIGEGIIKFGDGCSYMNVKFRLLVFRPFRGEVMLGRIKSCTELGIRVTLGFFDDIFVPKEMLPDPSVYNAQERAWVWRVPSEETDGEPSELFMDVGEEIRFQIESEHFIDISPSRPSANSAAATTDVRTEAEAPYSLVASCSKDGLGIPAWWN
ncbi:DNA-directed RNA polymerase III complex subunit Rpc25 [Schizosaccharomyces japonicus yFS275]|uniref:DNA-directed RNA polymerase subunit n=1 Tax=Schizosaccharomyces japonicus (strain yFS275 / FY16936) TaxID=402676 RepID=B6K0P2_SCHJY|nr:DNA-directed RNA polymerase III complex subunit Rpc25 [Schizosaccharomyces japonicus yFS275]EEB07513.1 DNA-directed RNA polymerase III complex subunit Rpc25 [Schizosaccharomyces japonicus yFS275]